MNTQDFINETRAALAAERAAFDQMKAQQTKLVEQREKRLADTKKQIDNEKAALKRQQDELQLYKKQKELDVEILELNVGGRLFMTQKMTLIKYNDSMLAAMFSGRHNLPKDQQGRIFIDTDPDVFELVLEYLRTGVLPNEFQSKSLERAFHQDMDYFSLGPSTIPYIVYFSQQHKSNALTVKDDGNTVIVSGEDGDHIVLLSDKKLVQGTATVTVQVNIPRPNRYALGVLPEFPESFDKCFAYRNGVAGWGLHDHNGSMGIYFQLTQAAKSTLGFVTNDLVTMTVDVEKGNLFFKVNGIACAELLDCEGIKKGVYLAATLFNKGAMWRIINI